MTKVEIIEKEIQKLKPREIAAFREWFHKFDSQKWDSQIEKDIKEGKLDKLAKKSIADHKAGRSKEF